MLGALAWKGGAFHALLFTIVQKKTTASNSLPKIEKLFETVVFLWFIYFAE